MIVRGARRAAFAPVSASSLPTKRKPPRAGCASLDECAFEDVLASSSASPVARISRRESAAPHPRATRVAARSSISAIFTPPRRIGRHGTAIHATASCVFLHAALTTRAIGSPGFGSPPRAGKPLVLPRSERSDARAFAPYTADLKRHLARAPRRLSRVRLRVCVPDASLCAKDALFLLELFPRWVSGCADEMVPFMKAPRSRFQIARTGPVRIFYPISRWLMTRQVLLFGEIFRCTFSLARAPCHAADARDARRTRYTLARAFIPGRWTRVRRHFRSLASREPSSHAVARSSRIEDAAVHRAFSNRRGRRITSRCRPAVKPQRTRARSRDVAWACDAKALDVKAGREATSLGARRPPVRRDGKTVKTNDAAQE